MKEANVNRLADEFRNVNRDLISRIDSVGTKEMDEWAKKRQMIVDRIFDHLHEKTGYKKSESGPNKAVAGAGLS